VIESAPKTTPVHHASRWRGGNVAAHGARGSGIGLAHWRNRARRCERCSHWTFGQAFQESGWSIGRNVHLDIRWTAPNDTKISPASGEVGCARAGQSRKWTALWLRAGGRVLRRDIHSPLNSTRSVSGLCCGDHADRPADHGTQGFPCRIRKPPLCMTAEKRALSPLI
jgi:hypothetical protein